MQSPRRLRWLPTFPRQKAVCYSGMLVTSQFTGSTASDSRSTQGYDRVPQNVYTLPFAKLLLTWLIGSRYLVHTHTCWVGTSGWNVHRDVWALVILARLVSGKYQLCTGVVDGSHFGSGRQTDDGPHGVETCSWAILYCCVWLLSVYSLILYTPCAVIWN